MNMRIAIVGGGASGVLAGILLKMYRPEYEVTIYEQNDRVLKKLLSTGNGMCNFDNINSNDANNYNNELIKDLINKYDYKFIVSLFKELGIASFIDDEGRIYPYSRKASNVVTILMANLKLYNVNVRCNELVYDVRIINNKYYINNSEYDICIFACGGCASINYDYNFKDICRSLGLNWIRNYPSLTALKVKENVKAMSGLRLKGSVSYYKGAKDDLKLIERRNGEILFKDDGLSGIVMFELSRNYDPKYINKVKIDLFDCLNNKELEDMIQTNYHKFLSLPDALIGLVPKMVGLDVIKRENNDIRNIANCLKNYEFSIIGLYDYNYAQVMRGGLDLKELDINSFESLKYKNLYFIGEGVDVDGTCGGFNLHFAWVSAICAVKNILKIKRGQE